ncbi:MAG: Clp protease N-terminal domain-containing protein [Candidatus Gastranaerophilales bacterium]|nr:Clp protease N-terminal domain-containing protein [Candidatus Gastranaerophilales bacterium]
MFEKFTEKAVDVVKSAQITAIELNHEKIYSEHLLIALGNQKASLVTKMLAMAHLTSFELKEIIREKLKAKQTDTPIEFVVFSDNLKHVFEVSLKIADRLGNRYIQPEHLFLALIDDRRSQINAILEEYNFDTSKAKHMLLKILDKTKPSQKAHPEGTERRESEDKYKYIHSIFKDPNSSPILERAEAKLSTSNYEIMGTEQIVQSILEDENSDLLNILQDKGINAASFADKLSEISSRQAEFEDKQIIFTPNALKTLLMAIETAKELGSAAIKPEHVILGLLKTKSGIAYNIFKEFNIDDGDLERQIVKPIEKQMNETLVILRLAKQEARRMGKNVVGSELILLGILLEALGTGATVLTELGITLKDAKLEVENLIGISDDYNEKEIQFSQRAKLILEVAWNFAKAQNKSKISSGHLLLAICNQPKSLAMKVLNNLGVDVIEIKQGIEKHKVD